MMADTDPQLVCSWMCQPQPIKEQIMIDTSSPDIPKIKKAALILCEAIAVPSRRREGSEGRGNQSSTGALEDIQWVGQGTMGVRKKDRHC